MGEEEQTSTRSELVREAVVFQLKLMADGLRDLVLLPISLIATLIGLLRGGDEPEREFLPGDRNGACIRKMDKPVWQSRYGRRFQCGLHRSIRFLQSSKKHLNSNT